MHEHKAPLKIVYAGEGQTGMTCEVFWEEAGQHLKEAGAFFEIRHAVSAGHYPKDEAIAQAIAELEGLAVDCALMIQDLRAMKRKT
jgi:hypothetical protein